MEICYFKVVIAFYRIEGARYFIFDDVPRHHIIES
jgi:hypothetical protein